MGSFAVVHALDTGRNGCKDFVGDCVEDTGQFFDGDVFAENLHAVTHFAVRDIGNVNHACVHADGAHDGAPAAVDGHRRVAPAVVAVHAVGITDRDCRDD